VGYGPATLRRVLRFRRFVAWADAGHGAEAPAGRNRGAVPDGGGDPAGGGEDLSGGGEDLAQVAFALGYADQAHLTRECVRLAGVTPAALVATRRPRPVAPS
jgi:AraC-like DNA-binding protein